MTSAEAFEECRAVLERLDGCGLVEGVAPLALADKELPLHPVHGDDVDVRLLVRVGVGAPPLPELECGERESPGDALSLDPLQADALELLADVRRERLSRAGVGGRRRTRTLLDRPKIPAYESVPVGKEGILQAIGRALRGGARL